MASIDKHAYAHMFGPTVGDRVRLADIFYLFYIRLCIQEDSDFHK